MILAIDFDGVIHDRANPVEGKRMGPPITGAKEAMEQMVNAGHTVVVHSQWGDDKGRPVIADWMRYWGIPYHEITNQKPKADVYLDDRAVRFSSWADFKPEQYAE